MIIWFMAPGIKIDSQFTYFGAVSLKHVRRFDLLLQILIKALVVACGMTQIPDHAAGNHQSRDQDL